MADPKFYSEKQLDEMGLMSRTHRRRLREKGEFPQPVKLSQKRIAYSKEAIDKWIAERMGGDGHAEAA